MSARSILKLAETVRDLTDSQSDIVHTEPRDSDVERSVADLTKAREQLGFEPKTPLKDGLEELVRNRVERA